MDSNTKRRTPSSSVLVAASMLVGCGGPQQGALSPREDARERLLGAWRLASLEEPTADGTLRKVDGTGLLVFTDDGHMSVQVLYRSPGAVPGSSPYAQDGYEASFGTFEVDDSGRAFTYRVEGALVRTLIGTALPRAFELTEARLVVTSSNQDERWRVVWQR
jgi:hypothetical protein